MLNLTEQECIEKIEAGEHFHAEIEGAFQVKAERRREVTTAPKR